MPKLAKQKAETVFRTAKPSEKPYRIYDGGGLLMLVGMDGSKKWRYQYTRPNGGRNNLSLGDYPTVSVASARAARDKALKLLAEGIDPGEERKVQAAAKQERAANSFEAVAREWYTSRLPTWGKSYAEKVDSRLARGVYPWIGGKPIADVTAPDLLAVLRRIEGLGAIESAHKIRADMGQIFRYAIATGRAERDPAADLRGALSPVKVEHMAALTEPKDVAALLRAIDGYTSSLVVRCALRLAPLVFVRPGELRQAQWADIDLDAAEWRYEVSKTRNSGVANHIVPLSHQAIAILRELQSLTGQGRYVFPSNRGEGRPMSDNTLNAGLRALGYDGDTMTAHGFRAMARTILDEVLGYPIHIIEQQLAHAVKDPLGRAYNRTAHLPDRRKMMQAWADYLDKIKAGADVIPFHRAA